MLNVFLLDCVKGLNYANTQLTMKQLKTNIYQVTADVPPETFEKELQAIQRESFKINKK